MFTVLVNIPSTNTENERELQFMPPTQVLCIVGELALKGLDFQVYIAHTSDHHLRKDRTWSLSCNIIEDVHGDFVV